MRSEAAVARWLVGMGYCPDVALAHLWVENAIG